MVFEKRVCIYPRLRIVGPDGKRLITMSVIEYESRWVLDIIYFSCTTHLYIAIIWL